ncbi:response regulator [Telluribacter sp.]|jgi:response regulator of citrate/malate metabolism|uniref:response regulator n=1 Tax=Telluribacter sp. TaxID=1978767 RepID=UPI002E11850A|nr:response regulator [Telluribacter sp.]
MQKIRQSQILIVEDNPDHWAIIQSAIKERLPGIQAILATTPDEAKKYLTDCLRNESRLPNLVLLDLYLPKREDGWGLLAELKGQGSPFLTLPVVVLSYSNEMSDISEVYKYGGTAYLVKPMDYKKWLDYFETLRQYWWNTVTLPGDNI